MELKNNNIRLNYARLLVQNNEFIKAQKILDSISGNQDEFNVLLVKVLLNAKTSNCKVAHDYLDQAVGIKGRNFVSESYRRYCKEQEK